ncbi:hypothetical protein KAFR_0D04550 [Kazachstania africana CBS 2517]|uniref:Vacuolar ATPase assembly protein VMA22 n=1 Tax=Kazachstania africana (strain ATCC 22294 / BCRC 22015 / CBS 2517 / CECT 1963 / NBRC 1671 / NRRL Y-8276) TaxID=1071382 RepID=H2AUQ3_KAZAF|nr:hypothetical protein KAFR_0D04550 [Kazachstania africana CBS 2517]CCF58103.1 hypothetical protein KAFR_0D04550 [Kazachstania africana CBS 2517]
MSNEQYIELVGQLSRYNELLDALQLNFNEGFYNLARANFHNKDSLRGKYGKDYYDESYKGQYEIKIDEEVKYEVVKRESLPFQESDDEDEDGNDKVRSRKMKNPEKTIKKTDNYDPILMFGGGISIPASLRNCQKNFKNNLILIIEMINLKNDIDAQLKCIYTQNPL